MWEKDDDVSMFSPSTKENIGAQCQPQLCFSGNFSKRTNFIGALMKKSLIVLAPVCYLNCERELFCRPFFFE